MTDWNQKQERFLQYNIPTRLGHLATNLARIKSFCDDVTPQDVVASLLKESLYFIEWTVPNMVQTDVDQAAQIVELGRALTRWLFNWEKIRSDSTALTQVQTEVSLWSQRVLDMSGLLSESTALA
ncbi:hypothetical protein ACN23B_28805 (plasmid) [Anabaena sp. FACHB-709]|uniref:Uncharacterized protein n=2 Tax=Nostocaceae TaxID=1162 RepID=A0A1Z4KV89_ANAVA|nr:MULTISPECIES: hypothetical protein [Nostocaceae]BAY72838.1 hypothetical protein NIES23_56660 [Trichormus variabilis NIES-23]MBD2175274.1 hypothetical protein [Anabaena cylindrica FACHB-318]MBD2267170.1 hypothetical protein [Anabaena sp. FACHB-709]MBD2276730.1 hypothetical protein [Nostoc sp. PCC 7120 = FACHB-418]MBD2287278.1 hypothetical protein [Anabaena cylindrica FACHB-170]